jgi:hypothetical protein
MNKIHFIAVAAAFALAGAVPAAAKVNVIQSPSSALAQGSSFAWAPVPARGFGIPDPRIANDVTADRLRALTEITLTNKGYRQVADPSQADFLVSYTVVIVPEAQGLAQSPTITTQGTLVLDLVERESGRLVLRATSEKRVTGQDVSQEVLAKLLNQMTKSLPAR